MSNCNCNESIVLPTITDDYSINTGIVTSCQPCDAGECSVSSEGSVLTSAELDACCHNENMVILGRVGSRRARFTKSGFIKLVNGIASVVTSVPLNLTTLWHNFWKTGEGARPILGSPLPFSYLAIGGTDGALHGIRGNDDEDSSPAWDASAKTFTMRPESENPKCQKGLLPRLEELELVGYAPIVEGGDVDAVRCLSSLQGSGIIVVNSVATVDSECACEGCEPSPSFASVASFLPNPESDGTYTLKVEVVSGVATHAWVQDA